MAKGKKPKGLVYAGEVSYPLNGRKVEVWTAEPCLQVYTANWCDYNQTAKGGEHLSFRCGVALETQHAPDSPNKPQWPTTIVKAGATYLDVNIGPAESNGPELMTWAVKLLQENFNNVPLALDTANKKAIEAGIRVYNRTNGKPIVNSADAGSRISNIDLAAANDAIVIALCSADGIAKDNEERMMHCHHMLERGLSLGMDASDLWFDPLFLVVKGMQDKQMDVLNAIKMFADEGLKSTGGLSNNSNGAPKAVRPILDSTLVAMAMMQGLTSAIVNPNDLRLMETIKSCDIFKNHVLYSDSYLDL